MLGEINWFKLMLTLLAVGTSSFALIQGENSMEEANGISALSVLVNPLLEFGSKLMVEAEREKKNVIFSPASIHCALNLVLMGSKEGSNTEKELLKALGYGDKQDNKKHEAYAKLLDEIKKTLKVNSSENQFQQAPRLDIWNVAIANEQYGKPEKSYLDSIRKYYRSDVRLLKQNLSSEIDRLVTEINDWTKTAGFDNDIIKSNELKEDFSLILLNAIRVEAYWFDNFYEFEAKNSFYNYGLADQLLKEARCLSSSDIGGHFLEFTPDIVSGKENNRRYEKIRSDPDYKKLSKLDFYAIQVPLQGGVSFVCLVPNKRNGDGKELLQLEDELMKGAEELNLGKVLEMLDQHRAEIEYLRLPKFKFEDNFELRKPLGAIGLKSIFDKNGAELNKISPSMKLYISEAKHQAMIEVNKAGLRAAGVTKLKVSLTSLRISPNPIKVEIDRPFLFLVRYQRIPLFMGHLMKI